MYFFLVYLKHRKKSILLFLLFCLIFLCVFLLYHLPAGAVLYPALLCMALGLIFLLEDVKKAGKKHRQLEKLYALPPELMEEFPDISTIEDADYQRIIFNLRESQRQLETQMNARYSDMMDYYTIWAHQIKTPIASMRLNLQNEDSELSQRISEDLFRTEQYVEMVLCYLRLGSDSTDYVFQEYDLDGIVRQAVRKFSRQFIRRKLRLVYEPLKARVVTDEKWLQFVLEQIISNALKYTKEGQITVELEKDKKERGKDGGINFVNDKDTPLVLCIRDTGIGIAPEDLPRVFEKGYTGYNGREDKKASGIGLYLCRRICRNLGHTLMINSSLESGTAVRIRFDPDSEAKE